MGRDFVKWLIQGPPQFLCQEMLERGEQGDPDIRVLLPSNRAAEKLGICHCPWEITRDICHLRDESDESIITP